MDIIDHIRIKGYRSIRELDLALTPFTVLIGANGAGKSNFIDYFKMLNSAFLTTTGSLQNYIYRTGRANSMLYYTSRITSEIESSISMSGRAYEFRLVWGAPDDLYFGNEIVSPPSVDVPEFVMESHVAYSTQRRESSLLGWDSADPGNYELAHQIVSTLRGLRTYHFHDTSPNAPVRVSQDTTREVRLAHDAGNLAVFLNYLKSKHAAHYRRILSTIQLVAPFITEFEVEPDTAGDTNVMLRWRDSSDTIFGPHQLSDGTIRAISLIAVLLQPEEMMPTIMLFDEPELGLHPSAVQLISSLLKAASFKRQVIVATQSPALISEYLPEDIVVVERLQDSAGRGESTFTRLDAESMGAWLEDYDLGELYEKNVTGGYPR